MVGGSEHILYWCANNDTGLHQLIIDELIFPYVMGEFLPLFLPELAGGLLFVFLKKDGGLRPLLCGSIWHRCAARLTSDCTWPTHISPQHIQILHNVQCAGGLQDGATRCAQLLNMLHDLPTDDQDHDDPVTFINTDIKVVFQEMCRQASFDTLTGQSTKQYNDGRVQPRDDIPTVKRTTSFPWIIQRHAHHRLQQPLP